MFYKNFCIFNMILLISKSFFKPYFIQSLSVHIHPQKPYIKNSTLQDNIYIPDRVFNDIYLMHNLIGTLDENTELNTESDSTDQIYPETRSNARS